MASTFLTLLAGAFLLLCFYVYIKFTHWKRHGIPTAKGNIPLLGHSLPLILRKTNVSSFVRQVYDDNRDHSMVGIYKGLKPVLVIREPNLIKAVLQSHFSRFHENGMKIVPEVDPLLAKNPFFNYGEEWSNGRKRLTYAFSNTRLKILFAAVDGVCKKFENFVNRRLQSSGKYEVDLKSLFTKFTAEVVANAGFGIEGHCFDDAEPSDAFDQIGKDILEESLWLMIASFMPVVNRLLGISVLPKRADRFFRQIVSENLKLRQKEEVPRNDFLQLMIELEKTGEKFDEETIVAHAVSFYLDGMETSSVTLSFVGYELAVHPDIQEKLRDEVKSTYAKHGGVLTYDALKDMTYMNQVISESQRRYTALGFLNKICTEEFELQGSDGLTYRAKPGTEIIISSDGLHHDPNYWIDPHVFDPERFNEDKKQSVEKMTFLPFGEGPRICVGMRMAMLQLKSCLATLLNSYKLELSPKTKVPLQLSSLFVLTVPVDGYWATISKL
ncbi:putative cytochrome P450 6a19 [Eufriesea mexicana]|uniref:cytochrome P450 9e2-like n=1 Tax=Eufriesea mexicana TaxID=516756 RepID=UPI00083BD55A|nr:PREDICTED: cytochrome P450 9e2-like [Eufriesea mexicana]OAD61701.1 putative cytochrome P450 6a19 [Eufriesea mexicana]